MAYLKRQFKTIAIILVPLAILVFLTSTKVLRTNGAVGARNVAQFMSGPYRIENIDLDVQATVPGIDDSKFQEVANGTKSGCPVARARSQPWVITSLSPTVPTTPAGISIPAIFVMPSHESGATQASAREARS